MNRLEAKIRDYLAEHLSLIEPNLSLIKTEFPLTNAAGADGSIDILARDPVGHYVVIEIKRSDQTARAALHELTKYVALLKATLGVRPDQIRALLLSTSWHELAVPFSEYQRICEVPTDGYLLTVTQDGTVTNATAFVPTRLDHPLDVSRQQFMYLFSHAKSRDASIPGIAEAAKKSQLKDFAIISFDYNGDNPQVIFQHAAYFIFSSPLLGLTSAEFEKIKTELSWDNELDDLDENFLCSLTEVADIKNDTAETGYPEKLELLFQKEWNVYNVDRYGRYEDNASLLTDQQLMAEATKREGGANFYLERTASPRYTLSWERFEQDVRLVLLGNSSWSKIFDYVIEQTKNNSPEATVSAHIYNPANIVISLGKVFGRNDPQYLPSLQLVVTHGDDVTLYVGFCCWNGKRVTLTAERWIDTAFGSIDGWMIRNHFGQQFERDDLACALVGLSNIVLEVKNPGSEAETVNMLSVNDGIMSRAPAAESPTLSIVDFYVSNMDFARDLTETIASFSHGLI